MPAPSLLQLATATAVKHAKLLSDVGNLPYALVRPILLKVDNPEKLHAMEVLSPQLAEEDQELWLEFIKRDIPRWEVYDLPEKTNRWYEIYCDLREEVQRSLDADAERMKMAIDGIKSERERLTPKIISGPRSKQLPGMRPTTRQRYVSYDRRMGGITPAFNKPTGSDSSSWTFHAPPIPRSELSTSGSKKKSTIFTPQKRNNALAVPTKHLNTRATQIKQAPRSLIEEHRRPADQPMPRRSDNDTRVPIAPGRSRQQSSSASLPPVGDTLAEREARLRAIASGKPVPSQGPSDIRKAPTPAGGAASPMRKPNLKRPAESPPPQSSLTPQSHSSPQSSHAGATHSAQPHSGPANTSPARPVIIRKRPDDIFIRPKKKRVV
ncbi:RNA polymerase II transcription factor SIII subunit A [Penicillium hispanicum]|uniref:RNA polymerase II transcription factor SIII subunit A n=1 Tax=Penicillium hispanicum TaxID=1080232 RepID=UPI0025408EE7|nr:RNA polymerase II transcription factor SIII subunit A [Penicillium hispanicum]KAJ5591662.1 RNA polymerase II transcription factor SIII subunit A [Penicillium hispanicum]